MITSSPLAPSSVGTWTLTPPDDPIGWRHLRLKISGPNASGQTHYLSVSGLELYGEIRGLADEDLGGYSVCVCVGGVQCVCVCVCVWVGCVCVWGDQRTC